MDEKLTWLEKFRKVHWRSRDFRLIEPQEIYRLLAEIDRLTAELEEVNTVLAQTKLDAEQQFEEASEAVTTAQRERDEIYAAWYRNKEQGKPHD